MDKERSSEALDDALLFLRRYFHFPDDEAAWVHALYAAYTWRWDAFMNAPRLVIDSPEGGSGKSTLGERITGALCRALLYSADSTAAGVYQALDQYVTVALDELDEVFRSPKPDEHARALISLINNGFDKGGVVRRGGERGKPLVYPAFRPMILMGNSQGKDGARFFVHLPAPTQSRCIRTTVIKAKRPAGRTGTTSWRTDCNATVDSLRTWIESAELDPEPGVPHADRMDDRSVDKWRPLVSVAMAAGGPWPERVAACIEQSLGDGAATVPVRRIVADTHRACQTDPLLSRATNPYGVAVATLTRGLTELGKPWDGSGPYDRLTDDRLRDLLRDYRVVTKKTHGGNMRLRWADLEAMWAAYLPQASVPQGDSPDSPDSPETSTESEQVNTAVGSEQVVATEGFGGYPVPKPSDVARQVEKRKKATTAAPGERTGHDKGPTFKGERLTSEQWAARERRAANAEAA